jgi:hypothetical protein
MCVFYAVHTHAARFSRQQCHPHANLRRCPLQYGRQQLNINGLANMAATGRSTMGIVNPGLAQVRGVTAAMVTGHSYHGAGRPVALQCLRTLQAVVPVPWQTEATLPAARHCDTINM